MSDRDRQFLHYYERNRVEDQLGYYERKSAWHGRKNDRAIIYTGALMFAASIASFVVANQLEWLGPTWTWAILAAVIPAVSSAVAATRTLYEHDRNRERFENTRLDLEYLQAFKAPSTKLAGAEYRDALGQYVSQVEDLLSREHTQWIQVMEGSKPAEPPKPRSDAG